MAGTRSIRANFLTDLGVPDDLVAVLTKRGITEPFDVQAATIPDALVGRDVCGRAPPARARPSRSVCRSSPGSARRASVSRRPSSSPPPASSPPRSAGSSSRSAAARNLSVTSVYGGVGYEGQRRSLNRGVDVLVACPGRLADLLRQGALKLDDVEVVVIDEADRMADMGFLPEVRRLLDQTPKSRQTLLFSATLDGAIKVLTRDYQQNAAHHEAGGAEPDGRGAHHVFWRVDGPERAAVIAELVPAAGPTIVFCRTRRGADRLTTQLERAGVRAAAIHGGRSQNQRDRALSAFKVGNVEALIATDVAAAASTSTELRACSTTTPPKTARPTCTARAVRPAPGRPVSWYPSWATATLVPSRVCSVSSRSRRR